jgi:hypothetical protein
MRRPRGGYCADAQYAATFLSVFIPKNTGCAYAFSIAQPSAGVLAFGQKPRGNIVKNIILHIIHASVCFRKEINAWQPSQ